MKNKKDLNELSEEVSNIKLLHASLDTIDHRTSISMWGTVVEKQGDNQQLYRELEEVMKNHLRSKIAQAEERLSMIIKKIELSNEK